MINRILEIVVFLIDFFRENRDHFLNLDDISTSLKSKGYTETEISSAYNWLLDKYESLPEKYFSDFSLISSSNRVLTEGERQQLSVEAQGFLFKLLSLALIDNEQFEIIIEQTYMVSNYPIDLEQIKMISSSVIFQDMQQIDRATFIEKDYDPSDFVN